MTTINNKTDKMAYLENSTCIDNIYTLSKAKGIGIGDLEKSLELSAGYFARLKRDGGSSFPPVEKLAAAADILGVNIDTLLKAQMSDYSESKLLLLKFAEKLVKWTDAGKLEWEKHVIADKYNSDTDVEELEETLYSTEHEMLDNFRENACTFSEENELYCEITQQIVLRTFLPGSNINISMIYQVEAISNEYFDEEGYGNYSLCHSIAIVNTNEEGKVIYNSAEKDSEEEINKILFNLAEKVSTKISSQNRYSKLESSLKDFLDFEF